MICGAFGRCRQSTTVALGNSLRKAHGAASEVILAYTKAVRNAAFILGDVFKAVSLERPIGETVMKPTVIVGIVLIIVGVIVLATGRTTYTDRDRLLEASGERRTIVLPAVLGGVALAVGVGLVIVAYKKG